MTVDAASFRQEFDRLAADGRPVGEVIGVNKFVVTVKGLHPVSLLSTVSFRSGANGFVRQVEPGLVIVFLMEGELPSIGELALVWQEELNTAVGEQLFGRVIGPTGRPLDDGQPITSDEHWPIFNEAPSIHEREQLDQLLETGVLGIDSLFPVVKGQRMALIGDGKTGKSTLAAQIMAHQNNKEDVLIYALVAKSPDDISQLVEALKAGGVFDHSVVVASTIEDSLTLSYLVPYVACAVGEYFWQHQGRDVVVIYDDLTTHAQVYREMSLVTRSSPGRDSYPGDIFHIHSSLLERAGRLARNHKTLTAIPLVLASGGDVTAYLPTNIISITDGQWILDNKIFRDGVRPAISPGLSVTRVGGRGHNDKQKELASKALLANTAYSQALEFSHFGSVVADKTSRDLKIGEALKMARSQLPNQSYSAIRQQLLLDIILDMTGDENLDITALKSKLSEFNDDDLTSEDGYNGARDALKFSSLREVSE